MVMEVKQRGTATGHRIILFIYNLLGYNAVAFVLNFVAIYYFFFAPSVRRDLRSYYKAQNLPLTHKAYFEHLRMFAFSIFDRFVSRIKPQDLTFCVHDSEIVKLLNEEGGIILLSHIGSWASAAHTLEGELPRMNIVMRENAHDSIKNVEQENKRENENSVNIIDLSQGAIASNIQIANALMQNELVALMADRFVDGRKKVKVEFLNTAVYINKNPFEIAQRVKKPLVSIFVTNHDKRKYDLRLELIKADTIEVMAQQYADLLQVIIIKHPNQWYNMYDFFKEAGA